MSLSEKTDGASELDSAITTIDDPLGDAFEDAMKTVEGNDEDKSSAETTEKVEDGGDQEAAEAAEDESDVAEEDGASTEAAPEPEAEGKAEQEEEALSAPGHWPKDLQDSFLSLDRTSQDILVERDKSWEAQATKKSMDLSDKAGFADGVKGLFSEQQVQAMRLGGNDELAVIGQLLAANQLLADNPEQYIKWVSDKYGLSVESQSSQGDDYLFPAEGDQPKAPDMDQIRGEIDAKVASEIETQRSNAIISTFTSETVEGGDLKYPHFEKVKTGMAMVMQSDPTIVAMPDGAAKMEAAYDAALYMNADLRGEAIAAAADTKAKDDTKAAAGDKAKAAKSAVKPKSTSGTRKAKSEASLDDIISDAMSSLD